MSAPKYILWVVLLAFCLELLSLISAQECPATGTDIRVRWKDVKAMKLLPKDAERGQSIQCTPCNKNTIKKRPSWHMCCADCPKNRGTPDEGARKCIPNCKVGEKFIEVDGKLTVCEKCEKNTYNDVAGLNRECKPCPGNLGTLKTGSKTLDDCVFICGAGYQPNSNGTACEPCPIGKFKDSEGVGYCKDCLMNRTTMEVGAINRTTDCVNYCGQGEEYSAEETRCVSCSRGNFKAEVGNIARCIPCPLNTYSEERKSGVCTLKCAKGYEQIETTSGTTCKKCTWGKYKSKAGNSTCESCPAPKLTVGWGSTAKKQCIKIVNSGKVDCVTPAIEELKVYYDDIEKGNYDGEQDSLLSVLAETCFDARSLIIKSIVNHYKQCGALKDIILPDISIGGHIYGHAVQQQLFLALADHLRNGGNYCEYLRCFAEHQEEVNNCKAVLTTPELQDSPFCSQYRRAEASCMMLNVKNCPALQFHPAVTKAIDEGYEASGLIERSDMPSFCDAQTTSGNDETTTTDAQTTIGTDETTTTDAQTTIGTDETTTTDVPTTSTSTATPDPCAENYNSIQPLIDDPHVDTLCLEMDYNISDAFACYTDKGLEELFFSNYKEELFKLNSTIYSQTAVNLQFEDLFSLFHSLWDYCDIGRCMSMIDDKKDVLVSANPTTFCPHMDGVLNGLDCFKQLRTAFHSNFYVVYTETLTTFVSQVYEQTGLQKNWTTSIFYLEDLLDDYCRISECMVMLKPYEDVMRDPEITPICEDDVLGPITGALTCFIDDNFSDAFLSHYDELLTELEANLARFAEVDITGVYSMRSLLNSLCGYLKSQEGGPPQ